MNKRLDNDQTYFLVKYICVHYWFWKPFTPEKWSSVGSIGTVLSFLRVSEIYGEFIPWFIKCLFLNKFVNNFREFINFRVCRKIRIDYHNFVFRKRKGQCLCSPVKGVHFFREFLDFHGNCDKHSILSRAIM